MVAVAVDNIPPELQDDRAGDLSQIAGKNIAPTHGFVLSPGAANAVYGLPDEQVNGVPYGIPDTSAPSAGSA